jgi:hypothetical protein
MSYMKLDTPNLANAIALLRDPSQWPPEFGPWDYARSCSCAMGLFRAKWGNLHESPTVTNTSNLIGISESDGHRAFTGMRIGDGFISVQPEDVARQLELIS